MYKRQILLAPGFGYQAQLDQFPDFDGGCRARDVQGVCQGGDSAHAQGLLIGDDIQTVSYTHLDVYKRQPVGNPAQGVGGVQIDMSMGQQLLHLVPISPPTHVSQNELEGACLFHRPKDHLWGAVYLAGKADIQSGVGQHNEAQLSAPVQDAQVAGVVKVHRCVQETATGEATNKY